MSKVMGTHFENFYPPGFMWPGHPCFACDDAMQIGIIAMRPMRRTLPQKNNEKLPGERNWRRTESEVFHETNAAPLPFSSRGLERERAQGAS